MRVNLFQSSLVTVSLTTPELLLYMNGRSLAKQYITPSFLTSRLLCSPMINAVDSFLPTVPTNANQSAPGTRRSRCTNRNNRVERLYPEGPQEIRRSYQRPDA